MVSAIKQKKEEKSKTPLEKKAKSSNIIGFLKSLASWIVGIVLAIIIYISSTTAYYNYNNEDDLPTDPNHYPYAEPTMKQKVIHHAKHLKNMGKEAASLMHKKGLEHLGKTKLGAKLGKHMETAKKHMNTIKQASKQRGGRVSSKVPYFYRKRNNYVSDWIADVLIYSWSSLRQNVSEMLPVKSDNVSLDKLGIFSKSLIFIGAPILVKLAALIIVPLVGLLRTFYGVFGESPTTHALLIAICFVLFPFPILFPVFLIISMIAGILQGGWFAYFFGIKGFMASKPGTFKETARDLTHVITIVLAYGLISSASSYLSPGAANGVTIGSVIMIVLAIGDIIRKMSKSNTKQ